jgi:hypothetical protein
LNNGAGIDESFLDFLLGDLVEQRLDLRLLLLMAQAL